MDPQVQLQIANSIWFQHGYSIKQNFIDRNKTYFNAEIRELDLNGNLEKKMRKEYQPVEVSEEFKKKTMDEFDNPRLAILRDKIFFPEYHPPFQYFFTDEEGHIFVMTNEESEIPGEYMYDIFNSEGLFISRTSLGNLTGMSQWNLQYAKARNKRLYCLKVKENESNRTAFFVDNASLRYTQFGLMMLNP